MNLNIAVLPGDGDGPMVIEQAVACLQAVEEIFGHSFLFKEGTLGTNVSASKETLLADSTLQLCKDCDAILFGGVDTERIGVLFELRRKLGLFAHIRPIKTYTELIGKSPLKKSVIEHTDFIIYRELSGGLYTYKGKLTEGGTVASDICEYSEKTINRIAHKAFKAARQRKNKLTLVDKANVLESSKLWQKVVAKVGESYPKVDLEFLLADKAAMRMMLDPNQFDIILTESMFGDILADEANAIIGVTGILPSASLGTRYAMFQAVSSSTSEANEHHGTNPIGAILATAMLLEHFQLFEEAMSVRAAVALAVSKGVVTRDLNENSRYETNHVGEFIANAIVDNDDRLSMNDENIDLGKSTII